MVARKHAITLVTVISSIPLLGTTLQEERPTKATHHREVYEAIKGKLMVIPSRRKGEIFTIKAEEDVEEKIIEVGVIKEDTLKYSVFDGKKEKFDGLADNVVKYQGDKGEYKPHSVRVGRDHLISYAEAIEIAFEEIQDDIRRRKK